jgi:cytochrome c-type biogenesis protein CcmH/NrfG
VLNIDPNNGEVWGALGHCYLMLDDLQKAYAAYQQALYHLPNPRVSEFNCLPWRFAH